MQFSLSSDKKIYITIGAFILAAGLLLCFGVWPIFSAIKQDANQIMSQRGRESLLEEQNKELEHFKAVFSERQENLRDIDASFVDAKNPIDFIKFLESSARTVGVSIDINLLTGSAETVDSELQNLQIIAVGDFSSITAFARYLEKGPYLIEASKMVVKKSQIDEKGQPIDVLNAIFTLTAQTKTP